ncbi:MAG: response regulator transcription factor [Ardenticatenaceae bacterium]|nr:response regulator transcription factor [Ardenticatenaceae bacterium]
MEVLPYKVMIVEDHSTAIYAFEKLIDSNPNLSVCCTVKTIDKIQSAVEKYSPDVVLVDIYLPENENSVVNYEPINQRGLGAGLKLKKENPQIGVLFTSALVSESTVNIILDSKHEGGLGFIQKGADPNEIIFALIQVGRGERHIDFKTNLSIMRPSPSLSYNLRNIFSPKEKEVLVAIASGMSREQTALKINISTGRVDRNLEQIRQKLRDYGVLIGDSEDYSYVHLTHLAMSIDLVNVLSIGIKTHPRKSLNSPKDI